MERKGERKRERQREGERRGREREGGREGGGEREEGGEREREREREREGWWLTIWSGDLSFQYLLSERAILWLYYILQINYQLLDEWVLHN